MAIKAERKGDSLEIEMVGVVGTGWSDDPITAKGLRAQLRGSPNVALINVHLNSIGGFVDEGLEIYQSLADHPARVVIDIGAQAVSCASLIAMAGDEIIMRETSLFLPHNPWRIALGDYRAFEKNAAELKMMAGVFAGAYSARTGKGVEEIRALMDEDRYMDAEEAKMWGFCTEVKPSKKKPKDQGAAKAAARIAFEAMKEDARGRLMRAAAMSLGGPELPDESGEHVESQIVEANGEKLIRAAARRELAFTGL